MRSILLGLAVALLPTAVQARCGLASFYYLDGNITSSGEVMNSSLMTTAHPYLAMGTRLRVTNQHNGRSVTVRVNDRGPFVGGRVIDLSAGSFAQIASKSQGVASVCYEVV